MKWSHQCVSYCKSCVLFGNLYCSNLIIIYINEAEEHFTALNAYIFIHDLFFFFSFHVIGNDWQTFDMVTIQQPHQQKGESNNKEVVFLAITCSKLFPDLFCEYINIIPTVKDSKRQKHFVLFTMKCPLKE